MIGLLAVRAGHHSDRIAAEVFVEAAGCAAPAEERLVVHGHGVVFVVECGVELEDVRVGLEE